MLRQVLSNTVKDDNRVVDAEPNDCQKGGDEQGVDLDVEQHTEYRKYAKHDEDVVQHRDECRAAIEKRVLGVTEGIGHVQQDANRSDRYSDDGAIANLG